MYNIDYELASAISILLDTNYKTLACCSGHNIQKESERYIDFITNSCPLFKDYTFYIQNSRGYICFKDLGHKLNTELYFKLLDLLPLETEVEIEHKLVDEYNKNTENVSIRWSASENKYVIPAIFNAALKLQYED